MRLVAPSTLAPAKELASGFGCGSAPGPALASRERTVIRVLLADDQMMFRTAVRRLLELEGDIQVVAEVARGDELVSAGLAARSDVAVVDIEMPAQDGITAATELKRICPSGRPLILRMSGRRGFVQRPMEGGISSFVLKDAPIAVLPPAIRRCAAG